MRFVRWDPHQEILATRHRIEQALEAARSPQEEEPRMAWAPAVDIFDRGEQLVLRAELPGVEREDIAVRVEEGVLNLHGERKPDGDVTAGAYRAERVFGAFARRFTLPATVDAAKISATYGNGVLEVVIPRIETERPKQIEIKAA